MPGFREQRETIADGVIELEGKLRDEVVEPYHVAQAILLLVRATMYAADKPKSVDVRTAPDGYGY